MMRNRILGKYDVVRRLAVGGMGEIFLARQQDIPGMDRLVVLKTLLPALAADARFVEEFLDEARIAATLNHAHIVHIHEVAPWEKNYIIAMEYVAGESLAALIPHAGRIPPAIVLRIAHDCALALHAAHTAQDTQGQRLGIVHRDVSPQNIMVGLDGVTKLVDFGIAKAANRASHTATGTLKGKLGYMSPEQVNGDVIDARSDQFSLGVVLWEALTGERLFPGRTMATTLKHVLECRVQPPSLFGAPAEMSDVVLRMLARDIEARYPSCAAVAEDLESALTMHHDAAARPQIATWVDSLCGDTIRARTEDLTPDPDARTPFVLRATRVLRASRWRVPILFAAVALTVGLGLWLLSQATAPARVAPVAEPTAPARVAPVAEPTAPEVPKPAVEATPTLVPPDPVSSPPVVARRRDPKPAPALLATPAPPAVTGFGFLTVQTVPWTQVYVDDVFLAETTFAEKRIAAGSHRLRFVNRQANIDVTRTVLIEPDKIEKLNLDLR